MCRLLYTCDCRQASASGSTGVGAVSLWLLRALWKLAELMLAAVIAVLVWATPRAWRIGVRATRALRVRWQARRATAVLHALAIETAGYDITWSELLTKQEANR